MKNLLMVCLTLMCLLSMGVEAVFSQETETTLSVFGKIFESDDTVLEEYPEIAKGHEKWKANMTKALESYHDKLSSLLHREQTKGDLEFLKGLENAVDESKTHHAGPCLLTDRLPPKVVPIQAELNKAKNRANKALIAVLDKEIASALKEKQLQKAKMIDEFFYALFLPKIMQAKFSEMVRFENKVYLFVNEKKAWQAAHDWCRERNGDLVSINTPQEQVFLYRYYVKLEKRGPVWTGGMRVSGKWYWSDGTPFGFTYWAKGQPGVRQDRISFGFGENGRWDDTWASSSYPIFVQWTLY